MRDNSNLDQIRERLNILDVVSTYIKVDKAGNSFRARCPFHNEKSPSFYVSPTRGTYHCFGCNEHGDIFGFVMKIEGINFKDALKILADKAGVSLKNFKKEEQSNLVDILEAATIFFEKNFSQNKEAQEYLKNRGVNLQSIQKFRIGFAPNDWRQLYNKLHEAGYTDEEIVTSGLCIKHEKGLYDRFRSRVMFPIMNSSGKVVAFSGRIIGPDEGKDGVAKYVNSPETPMYHKSSILFGYNFARQEIAKQKKVLVVEGQMDVVMSHQAGFPNTVAISGTAFTGDHIAILKRFTDTVVLALDSDKAGYNAMLKSAALALEGDMIVDGLLLTEKDPADIIKNNPENWVKIVSETESIISIVAKIILTKETVRPRQMILLRKDLFPLLRAVKSPLLKEALAQEVGNILGVSKEVISLEIASSNSEIEIPKKKIFQKKTVNEIQHYATLLASLQTLFDTTMKFKLTNILEKYREIISELLPAAPPEEIVEKEIFLLEKQRSENPDFNLVKFTSDSLFIFLTKVIEVQLQNLKEAIKQGSEVEVNLRKVQEYTKISLNLKKEIYE